MPRPPAGRRVRAAPVWVWRCLLLSMVAAATLLRASPADAHAIVRETRPGIDQTTEAPPQRVVMRFNEPVEVAFGAIRVYDTAGRRVDRGRTRHLERTDTIAVGLQQDLADGTYTVTWRVVSADGHPIEEAFVFHVGEPGEVPEGIAGRLLTGQGGAGRLEAVAAGVARWLAFASILVLLGAGAFLALVWLHLGGSMRSREVERCFGRRFRRVVLTAWTGAVAGTASAYVLQGAVAGDLTLAAALSPDVLDEVRRTRFGQVALLRLGLLAGAGVAGRAFLGRLASAAPAGEAGQRNSGEGREGVPLADAEEAGSQIQPAGTGAATDDAPRLPSRAIVAAAGVFAVALAATPGLGGHAGTTPPVALNVAADTLHVLAAACWMGGLVLLLVAAFPAVRAVPGAAASVLAPVVSRFSDIAVVAVAVLVATGSFRSWVEVRSWRSLGEPYGLALLAKLGVIVPVLALGLVNNRWLKPRLAAEGTTGAGVPLRALRRNVAAEVGLGAVVLAVTALLVNLAPARVTSGLEGPFITDVRLADYKLNVLVDPNQVGENEVHLTATTATGAPAPVSGMQVQFRMPAKGIGPLVGDGVELGPGHFVVQGRQLSVSGRWVLEVVAQTGRFDEARARVTVRVN